MGMYEGVLPCGCVQCTSTLEHPPVTYTIKFCDVHKPKDTLINETWVKVTDETKQNKDNAKK